MTSAKPWKLCSGKCFQSFACVYRADRRWADSVLPERFVRGARYWENMKEFEKCQFLKLSVVPIGVPDVCDFGKALKTVLWEVFSKFCVCISCRSVMGGFCICREIW